MVSTLEALRGGWEVLLSTMDVFLNEPVLDWVGDGADERQKSRRGEISFLSLLQHRGFVFFVFVVVVSMSCGSAFNVLQLCSVAVGTTRERMKNERRDEQRPVEEIIISLGCVLG